MLKFVPTAAMSDRPCRKTDASHYHALLGLSYRGYAIKGLFVCNSWEVSALGSSISICLYACLNKFFNSLLSSLCIQLYSLKDAKKNRLFKYYNSCFFSYKIMLYVPSLEIN